VKIILLPSFATQSPRDAVSCLAASRCGVGKINDDIDANEEYALNIGTSLMLTRWRLRFSHVVRIAPRVRRVGEVE